MQARQSDNRVCMRPHQRERAECRCIPLIRAHACMRPCSVQLTLPMSSFAVKTMLRWTSPWTTPFLVTTGTTCVSCGLALTACGGFEEGLVVQEF